MELNEKNKRLNRQQLNSGKNAFHLNLTLDEENRFGGERSRLWMLRQGKRAEEAGMISLTKNSANKINGSTNTAEYALAA